MNTTPEIGDVVELNSGGPAMVVSAHGSCNGVFVVWINQDGFAQRESFPQACLKKYEAPSKQRREVGR
jgi:uncharacterized protein YodC (DUF2158 family)